jgi:hypothetical protein
MGYFKTNNQPLIQLATSWNPTKHNIQQAIKKGYKSQYIKKWQEKSALMTPLTQ